MKRSRPAVEFWSPPIDLEMALHYAHSRRHHLCLTLPELPDQSIRGCHEILRGFLAAFEDHYEHQLARAYGWALPEEEYETDDDESDWGDEEI